MPVEYCPKCRAAVLIVATETRERRVASDGTRFDVVVRTVHCTGCHAFIRSEEHPLPHPSREAKSS